MNPIGPTEKLKGLLLLLCGFGVGFFQWILSQLFNPASYACPLHLFSTHGGHSGVCPAQSTCTGMPYASSNTKTRENYEFLLAGILCYKVSHGVGTDTGWLIPEIRFEVSVSLKCRWNRGLSAFSQISGLPLRPGSQSSLTFMTRWVLCAPPRLVPGWTVLCKWILLLLNSQWDQVDYSSKAGSLFVFT